MRLKVVAVSALGLALSGCQTTENMPYHSIGPGPTLEYSKAQCEILSMGTEQGMVAWGTPGYVAGAQLGNAIGNAMRKANFVKQCMIMQGWAQGAAPKGPAKPAVSTPPPPPPKPPKAPPQTM